MDYLVIISHHNPSSFFSRLTLIATYSWFNSIPMALRPSFAATIRVVAAPEKGSRTVQGMGRYLNNSLPVQPSFGRQQEQEGCQPVVICSCCLNWVAYWEQLEPSAFRRSIGPYSLISFLARLSLLDPPTQTTFPFSTTLTHGAPHFEQHPFSEVPALIHRSGIAGGKTAKWLDFLVSS